MEEFTSFVAAHGYWLLAGSVLIDQIGIPIPAIPVLIASGALAGTGQLDVGAAIAASMLGSLPSDLFWFYLGRRRGVSVLKMLCRISLEPDYCVRNTEQTFERYGARSLLYAKLIPGYQTLSPALAGMSGMSVGGFLAFDVPGALLWSAVFIVPGFLLHDQLDRVYQQAAELGSMLFFIAIGALLVYIVTKFVNRHRFIRSLRISRIEPSELKKMVDEGHDIAIVDLRSSFEIAANPYAIERAQVMTLEEIGDRHDEIPRDRDIILYCT